MVKWASRPTRGLTQCSSWRWATSPSSHTRSELLWHRQVRRIHRFWLFLPICNKTSHNYLWRAYKFLSWSWRTVQRKSKLHICWYIMWQAANNSFLISGIYCLRERNKRQEKLGQVISAYHINAHMVWYFQSEQIVNEKGYTNLRQGWPQISPLSSKCMSKQNHSLVHFIENKQP